MRRYIRRLASIAYNWMLALWIHMLVGSRFWRWRIQIWLQQIQLVESTHTGMKQTLLFIRHGQTTWNAEQKLPGQKLKAGMDVNLSISYPVLHDAEGLKRRREEWDETMRGVVSIGAAKGNEIIGEWIDRATRGEITAEEMPVAPPASSRRPLEIAAPSGVTRTGFSGTAEELHAWIGKDASIETPGVACRIRAFFAEKKLMLENCSNPEISAETLMDMVRSEYGGILTLQSIAAVLGRRRS